MIQPPTFLLTHEFAPFRGGVATYVREAAAAARRLGEDVRVLAPDYHGQGTEEIVEVLTADDSTSVPVRRVPGGGRLNPRGVLELAAGLWRNRARLAGAPLIAGSAGAIMALILLDRAGLFRPHRLLCFFHGSEVLKLTRRPFWKLCAPGFFRRWPHAAVASRYVASLLGASGWWAEDHSRVPHLAPCACSGAFDSMLGRALPVVESGRDSLCVLTVARLHPRKGQLDVARACARLPEALRSRVVYQIAGTGSAAYRQEVESVCQAGKVRLELLGRVGDADLPAIYRGSTVFAQASRTLPESVEGFGISYLEAAACGRPVVAYASGGTPEAVLDGRTGLLVPEGEVDSLAGALARLLGDAGLRGRFGVAGREHARTFSWETAARVLCDAARAATPAS